MTFTKSALLRVLRPSECLPRKKLRHLGESFLRSFEERDKEYDAVINKVVQHLLVKRKKKVVVYYLNKH